MATPPAGGGAAPAASGGAAPANGGAGSSSLSGAGASFPAPLYQRWFSDYNKTNPGTQISYQSVGSGAGVEQYLAGTVDFGATDAPLKPEERAKFKAKYNADPVQVPMTGGSVAFAYNLDGVKRFENYLGQLIVGLPQVKSPSGTIRRSSKPTLVPKLPDQTIQFVHRSDGSGDDLPVLQLTSKRLVELLGRQVPTNLSRGLSVRVPKEMKVLLPRFNKPLIRSGMWNMPTASKPISVWPRSKTNLES